MEKRKRRRSDRAGRPAMRSPGRPRVAGRAEQQRFWKAIARGLSSEEAAVSCGMSSPVGGRWFREGGGMPPISLAPPSARSLCGIVRLIRLDPKNLQSRTIRLQVDATRPGRRLGLV